MCCGPHADGHVGLLEKGMLSGCLGVLLGWTGAGRGDAFEVVFHMEGITIVVYMKRDAF